MNQFRVTKYNPANRDDKGLYLNQEEWTDFSDVGSKVSLVEYERVELAYIKTAICFLSNAGVKELKLVGLENTADQTSYNENDLVLIDGLDNIIRSVLRNEFWCKFESSIGFIHFGWDFYMYIGVESLNAAAIEYAQSRGLFIEKFISPYYSESA